MPPSDDQSPPPHNYQVPPDDSPTSEFFSSTAYNPPHHHRRQSSLSEQTNLLGPRRHTSQGDPVEQQNQPVRPRPPDRPFSFEVSPAAALAGRPFDPPPHSSSYTNYSEPAAPRDPSPYTDSPDRSTIRHVAAHALTTNEADIANSRPVSSTHVETRTSRPSSRPPSGPASARNSRPPSAHGGARNSRPSSAHAGPRISRPSTSYTDAVESSNASPVDYFSRPTVPRIPQVTDGNQVYYDPAANRSHGQLSTRSDYSTDSWPEFNVNSRWARDLPSPSGDWAVPSGDSQYSWRDSMDSSPTTRRSTLQYADDSQRGASPARPPFPSQALYPPDSGRNSSNRSNLQHMSMLSTYSSADNWRESSVNNPHLSTLLGISAPWRDSTISGSSSGQHRMSTFSGFSADSGQGRKGLLQPSQGTPAEHNIKRKELGSAPGRHRSRKRDKAEKPKDPNLVTWNGPDDPENPRNWSVKRKWAAVLVVSSFTFITPVTSSIVAPGLDDIAKDLNIVSDVALQMTLSIFVLAYAIGPLLLAPLSEVYGRVYVLQGANLFYLAWNLACGFARNQTQLIIFRFMAGLGGSAPLAVGGGVLSDCFVPEQRGKAISVYALAPLLGPAIGPIAGGFIAQYSTWRWVFWATSAVDVAIQVSGFFFLQETYHPKLLKVKADKLRKETGNELLHTEYEQRGKSLAKVIRTAAIRPFRLLTTQPIVQVIACYVAFLYGLMYLLLSTFPRLWTGVYGESTSIGALNYISLGFGFGVGTQIAAPINDRIYRRLKARNNNKRKPEFRIPLVFIGSCLVPIGLFWYGWSAQAKAQWILPNIGCAIFGAGTIVNFQCMQGYIVDSYTRYAASGIAATVVLRSLAGFGFPLFAPYMYKALGYGWGNSVLGFVALCIGIPAPYLFWFYGEKLRKKSPYAAGGGFK